MPTSSLFNYKLGHQVATRYNSTPLLFNTVMQDVNSTEADRDWMAFTSRA